MTLTLNMASLPVAVLLVTPLSSLCVSLPCAATMKSTGALRPPMTRSSALMRSPHHLHGLGNVAPLLRLVVLAPACAGLGLLRGLRDRRGAVFLEHLARDG